MKTLLRFTLSLAAACAVLPVTGLFAQAPAASPSATPSVSVPAGPGSNSTATAGGAQAGQGRERLRAAIAALTPQEREQFKTAREKALTDPAVKAAEPQRASDPQAFRKVMVEAMLRADPSIAPILAKMRDAGSR